MSAKKKTDTTQDWERDRDLYNVSGMIKGDKFFGMMLDEYQLKFKNAILDDEKKLIFCNAPAGSGKTVIAAGTAVWLYNTGVVDGIIYITAPVQEANMGFLPGSVQEKTDIYSDPFISALESIGVNTYVAVKRDDVPESPYKGTAYIECRSHNYMRGLDIKNKVIIVDEAQNFTTSELKKVLTRMHDDCKIIVIGHRMQCDLKSGLTSGFYSYLDAAEHTEENWISTCTLVNNYRGVVSSWADKIQKKEDPLYTSMKTK